ncbi:MAG: antibiotic biosynthesis monooxygenase family protein [Rhodospirillales bacterium]
MATFDPRRDPPYFAVINRTPPAGLDAGQFLDAGEKMIGLAAAEPGFLGIEDVTDEHGNAYTVCYWDRVQSLRRWRGDLANHIPPKIDATQVVCYEGCYWHWLRDVFDAIARVDRSNVVEVAFGEVAA